MSVLGPMLIFAGVELAKSSKDVMGERRGRLVAGATALGIIFINTLGGFLIGCIIHMIYSIVSSQQKGSHV